SLEFGRGVRAVDLTTQTIRKDRHQSLLGHTVHRRRTVTTHVFMEEQVEVHLVDRESVGRCTRRMVKGVEAFDLVVGVGVTGGRIVHGHNRELVEALGCGKSVETTHKVLLTKYWAF